MSDLFVGILDGFLGENYSKISDAFIAAKYALESGGKRFRLYLSLEAAKAFGNEKDNNARRLAVAVELIHNYSLIHDDLPCMDNADMRRGQPSCQKKFGETQATLAGDGLLNMAAEVILGGYVQENYLTAAKYLFDCSGFNGMVFGQSVDVENKKLTFEEYRELARLKTSKLLCASVVPQAILGGADEIIIKTLTDCCEKLGLVYQFVDDMSDKDEDEEKVSVLNYFDKNNAEEYILQLSEYIEKSLHTVSTGDKFDFFVEFLNSVTAKMGG